MIKFLNLLTLHQAMNILFQKQAWKNHYIIDEKEYKILPKFLYKTQLYINISLLESVSHGNTEKHKMLYKKK